MNADKTKGATIRLLKSRYGNLHSYVAHPIAP